MRKERIVRRVTFREHSVRVHKVSSRCTPSAYIQCLALLRSELAVAALGLMDHDTEASTVAYASLIQTFNRFLLDQMTAEADAPGRNPSLLKRVSVSPLRSPLTQLLAIEARTLSVCPCGGQTSRDSTLSVVDLIYPRRVSRFYLLNSAITIDAPLFRFRRRCRTRSPPRLISRPLFEIPYIEKRSRVWSVHNVDNQIICGSNVFSPKHHYHQYS